MQGQNVAAVISEHSRPGTWVYQEKPWLLLSAKNLSAISPAKSGRLGSIYFWEVDLWLLQVRFCALSATFHHFPPLIAFRRFRHYFESDRGVSCQCSIEHRCHPRASRGFGVADVQIVEHSPELESW